MKWYTIFQSESERSSLVTDASWSSLTSLSLILLTTSLSLVNMSDVPQLLLASLNPSTRKQAEQSLAARNIQASFLPSLLHIVLDPSQDRPIRLAGSVYLKNTLKSRWEDVSGIQYILCFSLICAGRNTHSRGR